MNKEKIPVYLLLGKYWKFAQTERIFRSYLEAIKE